ncbi:MAG: hypothetical protein AMJ81_13290 [Phycisphaerae bacterium SM23_33]|jgi:hypothetical protein|nr:MAG: hypothetical protein AMJ81_13290 [Phycisphaerae bacterium SM23_33]
MRTITSIFAVLGLLALPGCRGKTTSISNSDYLLGLLGEAWNNARESLQSDQPNLDLLRSVHVLLTQRAPSRLPKDYQGSNKQQVLDKLKALGDAYTAEVASKMDFLSQRVRLKEGVKLEHVRAAFMKLDKDYRELEAMTR